MPAGERKSGMPEAGRDPGPAEEDDSARFLDCRFSQSEILVHAEHYKRKDPLWGLPNIAFAHKARLGLSKT
jgi:hypothetical protein